MNKPELQTLLQTLRAEIDGAGIGDTQARARLSAMITEIEQQLLGAEAAVAAPPEGLVEGLKTSVEHFEVEHPRFAGLLNQLVIALSAMGI